MATGITLCMMIKNEEMFLEKNLSKLSPICDDVIILDTGSTDKSIEIASKYTKKILTNEFSGDFSAMRNSILNKVDTPWILYLDADEFFVDKDLESLPLLVKDAVSETQAYNFYRYNFFTNTAWNTSKLTIRLFRNRPEIAFRGKALESVFDSIMDINGGVDRATIPLNHFGLCKPVSSRRKKYEYYIALYKEELKKKPENYLLYGYIALMLRNMGKLNEALLTIEDVLKQHPPSYISSALLQYLYGQILRSSGESYKAIAAFERAATMTENDPIFWNAVGVVRMERNEINLAIDVFNKAIALAPYLAHLYINKGLCHFIRRKYTDAYLSFERAIVLDPSFLEHDWKNDSMMEAGEGFQYETISDYKGLSYYNNKCLKEMN